MQTSSCLSPKAYSQNSRGFNSWWLWRSGHRHTRQYMTCGSPLRWETCKRPSRLLGMVIQLVLVPGLDKAFSNSSNAPFFFLSFLTKDSIAFSAHFSSSSPCFHSSNLFTAGEELKVGSKLAILVLDWVSLCIMSCS